VGMQDFVLESILQQHKDSVQRQLIPFWVDTPPVLVSGYSCFNTTSSFLSPSISSVEIFTSNNVLNSRVSPPSGIQICMFWRV
jgi:hypothetical protein